MRIGRYEIIEKIGEGGMSKVYKARDTEMNRFVALKTLKFEFLSEEMREYHLRLQMEAITTAQLFHPNIVITLDYGRYKLLPYFVMEYIEGRNLGELINEKGRLDLEHAIDIICQTSDALAFAHSKGVIHRDIKPGNVLLTKDGTVKLTDFGLAKYLKGEKLFQSDRKNMPGTITYLSPERINGVNNDPRSDIYSVGLIFYEMLTGEQPFYGSSLEAVILSILKDEPTPVRDMRPDIPEIVDIIIRKCLSKQPQHRYQRADDLTYVLKHYRELDANTFYAGKIISDHIWSTDTEKSPMKPPEADSCQRRNDQEILIIDDDRQVVFLLELCLNKLFPYRIVKAFNGDEAWKNIYELQPRLVICDVYMTPGMNGFELCRRVKEDSQTAHIPVILISSLAGEPEEKEKGMKSGAIDILPKPFSPEELLLRVERVLKLSEAEFCREMKMPDIR